MDGGASVCHVGIADDEAGGNGSADDDIFEPREERPYVRRCLSRRADQARLEGTSKGRRKRARSEFAAALLAKRELGTSLME